ncbi:MAG TPA: CapA family protein [Actinomycetota bacterium]
MAGRHRSPSFRWPLTIVLVAGLGGAGWAFRDEVGRLLRDEHDEPSPAASASPDPSPSPSPSPTAPPEPERGRLVIHGTGDVNLDPAYIPNLAANGYAYAWSGLNGLFRRDDLTVVNLECAASELGSPVEKEFNFRCDPAALPVMRRAGVEVANLGNNHSGDFGPEALVDTVANVEAAGIEAVGAGANEVAAARPAIFRLNGWKVAVLGFGGVVPASDWIAAPGHPGMADGDDIPSMVRAVRQADRIADLVFVSIHWGIELDTTPRADDVERAHAMIDAGADGIFGHHSHRLNPLEHYRGRPVAWGLGNFVWPNFSAEGATTAVAEFVVSPGGKVRGRLLPASIESAGHPVLQG